jgi:hypothetical protein
MVCFWGQGIADDVVTRSIKKKPHAQSQVAMLNSAIDRVRWLLQTRTQTLTHKTGPVSVTDSASRPKIPLFFPAGMSILANLSKLQTDTIPLLFIL